MTYLRTIDVTSSTKDWRRVDQKERILALADRLDLMLTAESSLADWERKLRSNWANFANLSILSWHGANGNTLNNTTTEVSPDLGKFTEILDDMWKWSQYAIIEAVEPFKLHPTSMSYIYKVIEHLKQLVFNLCDRNNLKE